MKIRLSWLVVLLVFGATIVATGCSKETEVGYGGDVKTAPGGAPPPGAKKGGGLTVDPDK
jgi:hypothetical protein